MLKPELVVTENLKSSAEGHCSLCGAFFSSRTNLGSARDALRGSFNEHISHCRSRSDVDKGTSGVSPITENSERQPTLLPGIIPIGSDISAYRKLSQTAVGKHLAPGSHPAVETGVQPGQKLSNEAGPKRLRRTSAGRLGGTTRQGCRSRWGPERTDRR